MKRISPKTKLLLLGESMTHAYLLKKLSRKRLPNFRITMLSSVPIIYNLEFASEFLEGIYTDAEISLNIQKLCNNACAFYDTGNAAKIDSSSKCVVLKDGREIPFDYLSLSLNEDDQGIEGVNRYAIPVRWGDNIKRVKQNLSSRVIDSNIIIIGAGKLGIELAFSIRHLINNTHQKAAITIIDAAQSILHGFDLKLKSRIINELKANQIELLLGKKVIRVTGDLLIFNDNSVLNYGYLLWTPYSTTYPLIGNSGLTIDERGRLILNQYLQLVNQVNIFGTGENIVLQNISESEQSYNPNREAEVILKNIIYAEKGGELTEYTPVKKNQKLISLGNKRVIVQSGNRVFMGGLEWRHKRGRDRKFIQQFKV